MTVAKKFKNFEIVRVLHTPETEHLGIAGLDAVVLGESEYEDGTGWAYGLYWPDRDGCMVEQDALAHTGKHVDRSAVYDGTHIKVSMDGELLEGPHYPDSPSGTSSAGAQQG